MALEANLGDLGVVRIALFLRLDNLSHLPLHQRWRETYPGCRGPGARHRRQSPAIELDRASLRYLWCCGRQSLHLRLALNHYEKYKGKMAVDIPVDILHCFSCCYCNSLLYLNICTVQARFSALGWEDNRRVLKSKDYG